MQYILQGIVADMVGLQSPTGLDKGDLNEEVTVSRRATSYSLHSGIQFGLSKDDRNSEVTIKARLHRRRKRGQGK